MTGEQNCSADSVCAAVVLHQLFADHVRDFDAGRDDTLAAEILEPHRRSDDAFDSAVVLLGQMTWMP